MQKSLLILIIILYTSCANIVAPTGGEKDIDPPKIKSITIVKNDKNSLDNLILFEFDENIQLNNWDENFYISPIIKNIQKKVKGKFLNLSIKDTLHNKSYNISLDKCIKDINEGNILDSLSFIYNDNNLEHTALSGVLKDAFTLEYLENCWIMLFDEQIEDSLLIKSTPKYISKTNKSGRFHFPNLINENYKILALSGFDLIFNTDEKIAFSNRKINTLNDTFISLLAFKENIEKEKIDSSLLYIKKDTLIVRREKLGLGQLEIITEINSSSIFQLLQKNKVISEHYFDKKPFLIKSIEPGKYQLKYILDRNKDKIWNTGNLQKRIQPEKVFNYQSEILIRSNWDLELEWIIKE